MKKGLKRKGAIEMIKKDDGKIETMNAKFAQMNSVASRGASVFFGSTAFSEFPVCELARSLGLDETIYNRSVKDLSIYEAFDLLKNSVIDLAPKKLFIEIGEYDIQNEGFDVDDFLAKYEFLLYTIHNETKSKIFIVSIADESAKHVNEQLKKMANETGCEFIDATEAMHSQKPELKLFNQLIFHLRSGRIDFSDAMHYVTVN